MVDLYSHQSYFPRWDEQVFSELVRFRVALHNVYQCVRASRSSSNLVKTTNDLYVLIGNV